MEASGTQRPSLSTLLAPLRLDASRAGSIADQVFSTLRSSIVTLQLTPATALSEQDIADRLKVSRQPVREAFIKLSEIGLVRVLDELVAGDLAFGRFIRVLGGWGPPMCRVRLYFPRPPPRPGKLRAGWQPAAYRADRGA